MKKRILAAVTILAGITAARAQFPMPTLPYAADALEPVMSRQTVDYHHGKHVRAYVDNLNRLIPGTRFADVSLDEISRTATPGEGIYNNGAQLLNHIIFFDSFAPESSAQHVPTGRLAEAIERDFGSFDDFRQKFAAAAVGQFGSGWAWLASDSDGKLHIKAMPNAENPIKEGLIPLLGFDVWEHSYYLDYRNRRADYIDNLWRIVDWKKVEKRYENDARQWNIR